MKRRRFIALAFAAVIAAPLTAHAQQPTMPVIGILEPGVPSDLVIQRNWQAFREQLQAYGYVEGRNVTFEMRAAESNLARLPVLADELVRSKVAIIVSGGTAGTVAARKVTATIPIVMAVTASSVRLGVVQSLARPGGNVTGMDMAGPYLKMFDLLREFVPTVSRVGALLDKTNPSANVSVGLYGDAVRSFGLDFQGFAVQTADEIEAGFEAMAESGVQGAIVVSGNWIPTQRHRIAELASRHRLPILATNRLFVDAGCLASFSANYADLHRGAARYVDRILRGAKPQDLAVEQPSSFEIVVNLRTAKAIGITVPQSVILRADEVIE